MRKASYRTSSEIDLACLHNEPTNFREVVCGSVIFPSNKFPCQFIKVKREDVSFTRAEYIRYLKEAEEEHEKEGKKEEQDEWEEEGQVNDEKKQKIEEQIPLNVKRFLDQFVFSNNFLPLDKKKTKIPKVLISVTGGAAGYTIPPQIEPIFSKGLMNVADATHAWIVTGGTDVGVMKAVGKAYRNIPVENVPCIGIATYNVLNNKKLFSRSDDSSDVQFVQLSKDPDSVMLNPSHTHFIMVDGEHWIKSNAPKFGQEIRFRSDFELALTQHFEIPLLLLVVGGGPGTLQTVYEAVIREFPIVLIEKSGGVCDIIANKIKKSNEGGSLILQSNVFPSFKGKEPASSVQLTKDEWTSWRDANSATPYDQELKELYMKTILEKKTLVRVFDYTQSEHLDVFIFETILLSPTYVDFNVKLNLAVECNQPEATVTILESAIKGGKNMEDAYVEAMQKALIMNRPAVFEHVLQTRYAKPTIRLLRALYRSILSHKHDDRFRLVFSHGTAEKVRRYRRFLTKSTQTVFASISTAFGIVPDRKATPRGEETPLMENAQKSKFEDEVLRLIIRDVYKHAGPIFRNYGRAIKCKLGVEISPTGRFQKAKFVDVMLWALLMGYTELAKHAWMHTSLSFHTALVASGFCKYLGEKLYNENMMYTELSKWFEEKAYEILDELQYRQAKEIFEHKIPEFKKNALATAEDSDCKKVTSHPFVQRSIDEMLYSDQHGSIPASISPFYIILCIFFPFTIMKFYWPGSKEDAEGEFERPQSVNAFFRYVGSLTRFYTLPVVKFWTNTILYIGFILLLSWVVVGLNQHTIVPDNQYYLMASEIVLYIWIFGLILEEATQAGAFDRRDRQVHSFQQYRSRVSNRIDIAMLLLCIIFIALKALAIIPGWSNLRQQSVNVMVTATIVSYLRLLQVFAFSPSVGPLYFVMLKLTRDVAKWLYIFVLFFLGFTLAFMAFTAEVGMDPWTPVTNSTPGTFGVAFFTIIGDFSETFEVLNDNTFAMVVLVLYAMISQVILVNLLIAMMGSTFMDVKDNSDKEWKFSRFGLVTEFQLHSAISPPLNLLVIVWKIFNRCFYTEKFKYAAIYGHELTDQDPRASKKLKRMLKASLRKSITKVIDRIHKIKRKDIEVIGTGIKEQIKHLHTTVETKSPLVLRSIVEETLSARKTDNRVVKMMFNKPILFSWEPGVIEFQAHKLAHDFRPFVDWSRSIIENQQEFELRSVHVQSVDTDGPKTIGVKIKVGMVRHSDDKNEIEYTLFLGGETVVILIVLKLQNPESEDDGTEYTIVTCQRRVSAGLAEFCELPSGQFNSHNKFSGFAAHELKASTEIEIEKDSLLDLGQLAHNGKDGVYLNPSTSDELVHIFLHKKKVDPDYIHNLTNKLTGDKDQPIWLKILPLSQLHKSSPDSKALSALYLYHTLQSLA